MSYERTPEVRERNRKNARGFGGSCPDDCTCGRHNVPKGRGGRKCVENCSCGRHVKSEIHRARIGEMNRLAWAARKAIR